MELITYLNFLLLLYRKKDCTRLLKNNQIIRLKRQKSFSSILLVIPEILFILMMLWESFGASIIILSITGLLSFPLTLSLSLSLSLSNISFYVVTVHFGIWDKSDLVSVNHRAHGNLPTFNNVLLCSMGAINLKPFECR